jgi:hypothetical protein
MAYRKQPSEMTDKERAEYELGYAARKLGRMTTPKRLYRPLLKNVQYSSPADCLFRGYVNQCKDCGRDCQGQRCRECWNERQWEVYNTARREDDERLALVEAAFSTVVKRQEKAMAKTKTAVSPIARSTSGLREVIFEEMDALRRGESNPQRARSMAAMANSILQSVQVEIEYHKYVNSSHRPNPNDKKVVQLGTNIPLVEAA